MAKVTTVMKIVYFAGIIAFAAARRSAQFAETLESDIGNVRIFGPTGPKHTDVAQGKLGTCYFLATIASIAQKHPHLIEQMFVNREMWKNPKPVYTTRWLLNGKDVTVAVDGQVPANESTHEPFFVGVNDGSDFWPLLLEKAWAKIFGSFWSVKGGQSRDAFKAITQAPIELINLDESNLDKAMVWMKFKDANVGVSNFPLTASIRHSNNYNLPFPHAYSILEVSEDYNGHGRAVHLNNPWGTRSRYCGSIPNDQKKGSFWMTFDEFVDGYSEAFIAKVRKNYFLTWETLPLNSGTTTAVLEFEMKDDLPFSVQLEWPSDRYTEVAGCAELAPRFSMGVAKEGDLKNAVFATKGRSLMSNARADLAGKGKYVVFVTTAFPNGAWLKDVVVNVYAAERPTISKHNQDPWDIFLQMMGLCKQIQADGTIFVLGDKRLNGYPVFEAANYALNRKRAISYEPDTMTVNKTHALTYPGKGWMMSNSFESAKDGHGWKLVGATCYKPPASVEVQLNTSVVQVDMKTAATVLDINPLESQADCIAVIARLSKLNNWEEILEGDDPLFPTSLHSISKPGQTCGDSASGPEESCEKFNTWEDISKIDLQLQHNIVEQKRTVTCLKGAVKDYGGTMKCQIKNTCSSGPPSVFKGRAASFKKNIKERNIKPGTTVKGALAYCELLSDIGVNVTNLTLPDPCS